MKRFKTIALGAGIAIVAVLMLSGCDQILSSFYPEFGNGGTTGQLSIQVSVNQNVLSGSSSQIYAQITSTDTSSSFKPTTLSQQPQFANGQVFAGFNFNGLPKGTYRVRAWVDAYPQGTYATWQYKDATTGSTTTTDQFPINVKGPDGNTYSSRNGNANISNANYAISFSGQFVVDSLTGSAQKNYTLTMQDSTNNPAKIKDYEWDLYNYSDDSFVDSGYDDLSTNPVTSSSFNVNWGNYGAGLYWVYLTIDYTDGTRIQPEYLVTYDQEASSGASYTLNFTLSDLSYAPITLSNSSYPLLITIHHTATSTDTTYNPTATVSSDSLGFTIGGLSYQQGPNHGTAGADTITIVVDVNGDGKVDTGDLEVYTPLALGLTYNDGSSLDLANFDAYYDTFVVP